MRHRLGCASASPNPGTGGRSTKPRDEQSHRRLGRAWLLLLAGLGVLLLQAAAGCQSAAKAGQKGAESASPLAPVESLGSDRVWPSDLALPSERSLKADQIEALGYKPEVIIFGGSRSERFDPAYVRRKTGLTAYNLAMACGKAEDAFAFAHFLQDRAPGATRLWIWGVQRSILYTRDIDSGLVQDPRLSRYLPTSLLRQQARSLPTDPSEVRKKRAAKHRHYSPQGMVLHNAYDTRRARGLTLEHSLQEYIRRMLPKLKHSSDAPVDAVSRSRQYFERTLGFLNECGITPILVSMPVHPAVLAVFREHDWQTRQDEFVDYLKGLQGKYDFRFMDLTEISSFGGDTDGFYDGVHIDAANTRRIVDTLFGTFPELFGQARN
jgi:hypothetical protein